MHTDINATICANLCASVFELSSLDYYPENITIDTNTTFRIKKCSAYLIILYVCNRITQLIIKFESKKYGILLQNRELRNQWGCYACL